MDIEQVKQALQSIRYPVSKDQLIAAARERGRTDIIPFIEKLPNQTYNSANDILSKIPADKVKGGFGM